MKFIRRSVHSFFLISLVIGPALISTANAADANRQVQTPNGTLEGEISADRLVRSFKGIPYAAPPVGNLRWKPPQSAANWTGVRKAAEFGARCMQGNIYGDMVFRDNGPSEDCLYLNVWTPAKPASTPLPVMVWIYGGGFMAGATSEPRQDGGNLTKKGVIVVSMNYRLGVFGFFAHPDLTKESAHNASGNYGLLDQVAALEWVHDNIALFGGDPANVTIFGESAGSFSVSAMVATPLARGLFQKAIGESGALFNESHAPQTLAEAEADGVKFAQSLKGDTAPESTSLDALRAKSATDLLKAQADAKGIHASAIIDGYLFPQSVDAIYAQGKQNHVALMAGWNQDEGGYGSVFKKDPPTAANYAAFAQTTFGDKAATFLKLYAGATDAQAQRSASDYSGDKFIAYSTWKWLEMHRATGESPVYRYEFDQAPPGQTRGAYHSAEIEFVFNVLPSKNYPWRPEDFRLSNMMSNYWTNFAKTGDPNGPSMPTWPAYKTGDNPVMHLSGNTHTEPDTHRGRYEFLDSMSPYHAMATASK